MQANTEKAQRALVALVARWRERASGLGWKVEAALSAPKREDCYGGRIEGSWAIVLDIDPSASRVEYQSSRLLRDAAVQGLDDHIGANGRAIVAIDSTMAAALASIEATVLAVIVAGEALMDAHRAALTTAVARDQRALDTI